MQTLVHLWDVFLEYFREGLSNINPILGITLAIVAGLMASGFVSLLFLSLVAVVVYILADAFIPVVLHHAPLVLPLFDRALLHYSVTLYVAFFVAIGAILLVKMLFSSVRG
jgi:hypothetical protein